MILFIGLSLDTGKIVLNCQQLQDAADAAALAGAMYVRTELPEYTRQRAADVGLENTVDGLELTLRTTPNPQQDPFPTTADGSFDFSSYDIIVGRWVVYNSTFLPTLDAPNAVMVIARRNTALADQDAPPLRFIWGPIVGVDTADAEKVSVGFCQSSSGAGLIVLSSDPIQGLDMGGGPIIDIDGGGIHVNSTSQNESNNFAGAWVSGNTVLDAGFLNVVGTVSPPPDDSSWEAIFANAQAEGEAGAYPVMDHTYGIQHIDDPLAAEMLTQGEPYVVPYYAGEPEAGPGARLDLPASLDSQGGDIPTRYAMWNGSTYEFTTDPSLGWHATVGQDDGGGNVDADVDLPPGYYPYGMSLSNGDDIRLDPELGETGTHADKLFMFGGGTKLNNNNVGLYMTGGSLIGHGVTCYVTQTFDSSGASIGVSGLTEITGGHLDIDSPGDWVNQNSATIDPSLVRGLNGIAIWQDPDIPGSPEAFFRGNGDFYFPDPIHVRLAGDLGDTGNQILCGTAEISGTASIHVNYDGRNPGVSPQNVCLVQ